MPGILKFPRRGAEPAGPQIYAFPDLDPSPESLLDQAREQANALIAAAEQEAERIRREAAEAGLEDARRLAKEEATEELRARLSTALSAVRQAADSLCEARDAWQCCWETAAVRLAVRIAEKIVRREIQHDPRITRSLVHEALLLSAGGGEIRVRLHPDDMRAIGDDLVSLRNEFTRIAPAEFIADPTIEPGGCVVETRHGTIDQQLSTQLSRIEAELCG